MPHICLRTPYTSVLRYICLLTPYTSHRCLTYVFWHPTQVCCDTYVFWHPTQAIHASHMSSDTLHKCVAMFSVQIRRQFKALSRGRLRSSIYLRWHPTHMSSDTLHISLMCFVILKKYVGCQTPHICLLTPYIFLHISFMCFVMFDCRCWVGVNWCMKSMKSIVEEPFTLIYTYADTLYMPHICLLTPYIWVLWCFRCWLGINCCIKSIVEGPFTLIYIYAGELYPVRMPYS